MCTILLLLRFCGVIEATADIQTYKIMVVDVKKLAGAEFFLRTLELTL